MDLVTRPGSIEDFLDALYRRGGQVEAIVYAFSPTGPVRLSTGTQPRLTEGPSPMVLPVDLNLP